MPWNNARRWQPMTDQQYIDKIKARCIVSANGCWNWQGAKHKPPKPYGMTSYRNQKWRTHRLMYTLMVGPIPPGHDVCHSCDNHSCCNPAHLWIGTRKDNMADCVEKARHDSMKRTHCKHGHEYTPENTYWSPPCKARPRPARHCKRCNLIRLRMSGGWTREQVESLPITPHGYQPVGGSFKKNRKGASRE